MEAAFVRVPEESLKPLLPVVQGLMRLMPSHRISISQALDLVRVAQKMLPDGNNMNDSCHGMYEKSRGGMSISKYSWRGW